MIEPPLRANPRLERGANPHWGYRHTSWKCGTWNGRKRL